VAVYLWKREGEKWRLQVLFRLQVFTQIKNECERQVGHINQNNTLCIGKYSFLWWSLWGLDSNSRVWVGTALTVPKECHHHDTPHISWHSHFSLLCHVSIFNAHDILIEIGFRFLLKSNCSINCCFVEGEFFIGLVILNQISFPLPNQINLLNET
jgi:hypothetical protein